jgi:glycosyltransferase involved in cell wall biosynthesis
MREYYDLWPQFSATLSPQGLLKERVRRTLLHATDRYLLTSNVTTLFVQSRTIQQRLSMWPALRSTVLYPPAPTRAYRTEGYGPSFLFVSRLTRLKRADLVIRALATADGAGIAAVIAGEGEERAALERLASELGVANRVTFPGRLDDEQLVGYLARCRAVVFPPFQEDYGFVTAEAFASRKAVLTCRDSGGPSELVTDGVSGVVVEPTPEALGRAMRRLADDEALAERMGEAAFGAGAALTWPETVRTLVQ